jgi:phosphoglycolate phosphatase-like HAD superfamily hydrolase
LKNRAIIFDLDGTLLDVRKRRSLARLEVGKSPPAGTNAQSDLALRKVIERPELLEYDRLFIGAKEALQFASDQFCLILFTARQDRLQLLHQLRNLGISGMFTHVINTGGNPKSPLFLQTLVSKLSIELYVGDRAEDAAVARELRVPFIRCHLESSGRKASPDVGAEQKFFDSVVQAVAE